MDVRTNNLLDMCRKQEQAFQFEHFSREDALVLGTKLRENAAQYPDPVAIEITLNGLSVFRLFPAGTSRDNDLWLQRKRRSVELMEMSSLHFFLWLESNGETLESRKLSTNDYAAGGGGFPILLKGTGCIGSICVSGLPDHKADHQLIANTLAEWFGKEG